MRCQADGRPNERDVDDDLRRLFNQESCPERPVDTDALLSLAAPGPASERLSQRAVEATHRVSATPLARNPSRHRKVLPVRRLAVLGSLATAFLVSICFAWFAWQAGGRMAMADVRRALSETRTIHMVIHLNAAHAPVKREVWYRAGVGWALEDRTGSVCDNGIYRWWWAPGSQSVTRSKSRLNEGRTVDARQLAETAGIVFDEFSDKAARHRENDRAVDGVPCRAFELPVAPSVPTASHADALGESPSAKTVFLVDKQDRIRYCENQVLQGGVWVTYRKAEVAYDVEIAPIRFTPEFDENVVVMDSVELAAERDQKERPIDLLVAELSKGIRKRQEQYQDLMFSYNVTANVKRSPEATGLPQHDWLTNGLLSTSNVLKIMSPSKEKSNRPWRLWIRSIANSQGQRLVDRFAAYDQDMTVSFIRSGNPLKKNRGFVLPWEDTEWWGRNTFDYFLFMRINGITDSEDPQGEAWNSHLERFSVAGQEQVDGRTVYSLYRSWPDFGMEYFVRVSGGPEHMLLRWEARELEDRKRTVALYEATSIQLFQGAAYPASGRHRHIACGELPDVTYEFKVTSVEHLKEDDRKQWIPEWPPYTIVRDQITDLNLEIPGRGDF